MASYVVAAALFIVGSSYLLHFVIDPPGAATGGLEHLELRSKADDALNVLVGTPGYPTAWDAGLTSIETIKRLGLVETGASIRIDADKFDALAKGKLLTASSGNGGVDYAEAKAALGLSGYEFHLRAYPLIKPNDGDYGLSDFDDFRVAYVGDFAGGVAQQAAADEIAYLDSLNIDFSYVPSLPLTDDVFEDKSSDIRDGLLPNIGALVQQTEIAQGSGTSYQFMRVAASTYSALAPPVGTMGLALTSDGATLGYAKNLELRAIVGKADLSGHTSAALTWREYVDTDRGNLSYDCQDYGFVEVSPDAGVTWHKLTDAAGLRSTDCSSLGPPVIVPNGATMNTRLVSDITATCAACDNNAAVLIAYHWIADNDDTIGYGWVIDDVSITAGTTPILRKTFEEPEYDLVIIGSGADNNAFEPNDVKEALRDYVDKYAGRLFITGPQSALSVNYLDRLFDAGVAGSSGGVSTPDVTHPLLTLPNTLDYNSYPRGNTWDFTNSQDADLFSSVVAEDGLRHVLSVSRLGAWGSGSTNEGSVIISSYLPHEMTDPEEAKKFFANTITYGKFHYLYVDVGPTIPDDEAVASASRTATMNMHRTGSPSYTEMAFILYVWPGASTAATASSVTVPATAPTELSATAGDSQVTVSWKRPISNGSAAPDEYRIYRGNSPDDTPTLVAAVPYEDPWTPTANAYSYVDTAPDNGVTYYYRIRLITAGGSEGALATAVSATPIGPPAAPSTPTVATGAGKITVTWTAPTNTGGGTLFGYRILGTTTPEDPNSFVSVGEVGNVTTFDHAVPDTTPRAYKVQAVNGYDWGALSDASASIGAILPIAGPTLDVAIGVGPGNLTLTWVAPDTAGQTLLGYRILRATGEAESYTQLAYLNNPLNVSFTDVGLGVNITRYYKVQGVTNYGDGQLSDAKSAKTMATPDTPTWGTIVKAPITNIRTLTWNAVAGSDWPVVRYDVYRATSSNGALVLIGASTAATYVDSPGSGNFYYTVKAVSAAGSSDHSERKQSN